MRFIAIALLLPSIVLASPEGRWEVIEEEGAVLRLHLSQDGSLEIRSELYLPEDSLRTNPFVAVTYTGRWEATEDSLHVEIEAAEAEFDPAAEAIVPVLLAGIYVALAEFLTGETLSDEEFEALVEELAEEIRAGQLAGLEEALGTFTVAYELDGDTLVLFEEEAPTTFYRASDTAVAAATWGQVKRRHAPE